MVSLERDDQLHASGQSYYIKPTAGAGHTLSLVARHVHLPLQHLLLVTATDHRPDPAWFHHCFIKVTVNVLQMTPFHTAVGAAAERGTSENLQLSHTQKFAVLLQHKLFLLSKLWGSKGCELSLFLPHYPGSKSIKRVHPLSVDGKVAPKGNICR